MYKTAFFSLLPAKTLPGIIAAVASLVASGMASTPTFAQSTVNLTGNQTLTAAGTYSYINAYDNSTLYVPTGGVVYNAYMYGNSSVTVSATGNGQYGGGQFGFLYGTGTATINVTGTYTGSTPAIIGSDIYTEGQNTVNVSGGTMDSIDIWYGQSATVSGGTVNKVYAEHNDVSITGGSFPVCLYSTLSGNLLLTGSAFSLVSSNAGTYTNSKFVYYGTFFTISGKLQNNATVGTYTLFDANRQVTSSTGAVVQSPGAIFLRDTMTGNSITLSANTPEPSDLLLIAAAFPLVGVCCRRQRT